MALVTPLPLDPIWPTSEAYVKSILQFTTHDTLFRNLCGGIHILDFLTRQPELYTTVLPKGWRSWLDQVEIDDILHLLFRAPLEAERNEKLCWPARDVPLPPPPASLLEYVGTIRRHCLQRDYDVNRMEVPEMPRNLKVGMKPKKAHEVAEFAAYVSELAKEVTAKEVTAEDSSGTEASIVDFGSGQNYLGRTLASPPYEKNVIAIERRHHNVDGARDKDVLAKLASKEKIMRNKKEFKKQVAEGEASLKWQSKTVVDLPGPKHEAPVDVPKHHTVKSETGKGSMTYIEASIEDGDLEHILYPPPSEAPTESDQSSSATTATSGSLSGQNHDRPPLIVISLHSCGNLLHHGLRSIILNKSVTAVAMIGCCYNLMTERLGPATYKLPQLRPNHPRLEATGSACDSHGFPMSRRLETYEAENGEKGVRLNITARMMAVQAPYNWGKEDSDMFFRRHFYRALLQRILLDRGVVKQCTDKDGNDVAGGGLSNDGNSLSGKDTGGTPLIVGSLKKACFASFRAYVRGALEKLGADSVDGPPIRAKMKDLTDEEIAGYEADWGYAKKNLAVIWSLMAFSAGVVESLIAVDRWLFLKEQDCIERCWVEPVFEYKLSPRNLVVVGIKKKQS